MASAKESKPSVLMQGKEFFSESTDELKKVTTPTRAETIQATLVTLVIMSFVAISLALMDVVFSKVMASILV